MSENNCVKLQVHGILVLLTRAFHFPTSNAVASVPVLTVHGNAILLTAVCMPVTEVYAPHRDNFGELLQVPINDTLLDSDIPDQYS